MPRTPDRAPGPSDEEATIYESTTAATQPGEVRFDGSRFSFRDTVAAFDPREVLPTPTAQCVIVWSDDGTTLEQVVPLFGDALLVNDNGFIVHKG